MYTVYSHGAFGEPENYERLDVNKFAELIIKECSVITNKADLLKHFGIE
jgi:hypothetical protein